MDKTKKGWFGFSSIFSKSESDKHLSSPLEKYVSLIPNGPRRNTYDYKIVGIDFWGAVLDNLLLGETLIDGV